MINSARFECCRQYIYRYGRMLDRERFAYHFEGASREAALSALLCYQNPDGGFGHGLDLDVMCPSSTPICSELALYYLDDLGAYDSPALDRLERWALSSQRSDGSLPNPVDEIRRYPHGPWWLDDDRVRVLSLAGLLAKLGRGSQTFFDRSEQLFADYPFPAEIGKYDYPLRLYLTCAPTKREHGEQTAALREQLPRMVRKFRDHHPLFVFSYRWVSEGTSQELLESEARIVVEHLEDDGGLRSPYPDLPWWRPTWTLEALISLKQFGFLRF